MKNIYWFAGGAVVAVGVYLYVKTSVPAVIKDGIEAAGILGTLAVDMVTDPMDTFGISPGKDKYGVAKWEPTAPWFNVENDPVSNSPTGMNFNYF